MGEVVGAVIAGGFVMAFVGIWVVHLLRRRKERRAVSEHRDKLARVLAEAYTDHLPSWMFDAHRVGALESYRVAAVTTGDGRHFVQADLPLPEEKLRVLAAVFDAQQRAAGGQPWFGPDGLPEVPDGSTWETTGWMYTGPDTPGKGMFVNRTHTV
jgi:hypothetical protein